jgi:hypothetical protein
MKIQMMELLLHTISANVRRNKATFSLLSVVVFMLLYQYTRTNNKFIEIGGRCHRGAMMSSWPNEALPIGRWSIIIIDNWNQISNWASSKAAENVTNYVDLYKHLVPGINLGNVMESWLKSTITPSTLPPVTIKRRPKFFSRTFFRV